jgi:hypothetical protein
MANALNRFFNDFNPDKIVEDKIKHENTIEQQLDRGQPILTVFEQHLLLEHLRCSMRKKRFRRLDDIEQCLLAYIQRITTVNYDLNASISHLNRTWLRNYLRWTQSHSNAIDISSLNIDQL